jgi:hypothetical protein
MECRGGFDFGVCCRCPNLATAALVPVICSIANDWSSRYIRNATSPRLKDIPSFYADGKNVEFCGRFSPFVYGARLTFCEIGAAHRIRSVCCRFYSLIFIA